MNVHKILIVSLSFVAIIFLLVSMVKSSIDHQFSQSIDSEYYTPNASYDTIYTLQPANPVKSLQGSSPKSYEWR